MEPSSTCLHLVHGQNTLCRPPSQSRVWRVWTQLETEGDTSKWHTDKFHCMKLNISYEFLWQGLMPCSRRTLFLSVATSKCQIHTSLSARAPLHIPKAFTFGCGDLCGRLALLQPWELGDKLNVHQGEWKQGWRNDSLLWPQIKSSPSVWREKLKLVAFASSWDGSSSRWLISCQPHDATEHRLSQGAHRSVKKVLRTSVALTASFLHSRSTGKLCRVERNHALKGGGR